MSKESKYEITAFYDPTGKLYAFSATKSYVKAFETTRKLRGFYKKVLHLTETQFRNIVFFEDDKRMIMNVLTDGKHSFDFVTTQGEDDQLGNTCDTIYDNLLNMERKIMNLPLTDDVREAVEKMIYYRKKECKSMGKFNTFQIFLELFKDSIL